MSQFAAPMTSWWETLSNPTFTRGCRSVPPRALPPKPLGTISPSWQPGATAPRRPAPAKGRAAIAALVVLCWMILARRFLDQNSHKAACDPPPLAARLDEGAARDTGHRRLRLFAANQ